MVSTTVVASVYVDLSCAQAARLQARSMAHVAQSVGTSQGVPPNSEASTLSSRARAEWMKQDTILVDHLNRVFSPLQFPPDLASRILTHASHPDAKRRHNGRLSFVGECHIHVVPGEIYIEDAQDDAFCNPTFLCSYTRHHRCNPTRTTNVSLSTRSTRIRSAST